MSTDWRCGLPYGISVVHRHDEFGGRTAPGECYRIPLRQTVGDVAAICFPIALAILAWTFPTQTVQLLATILGAILDTVARVTNP